MSTETLASGATFTSFDLTGGSGRQIARAQNFIVEWISEHDQLHGARSDNEGAFAALEDELCGLIAGGGYEGPGRSPDRADALVWAASELMLGRRGVARVLGL